MMLGLSDNRLSSYSLLTSAFVISCLGMQGNFSNLILSSRESESRGVRLWPSLGPSSVLCWSQVALAVFSDVSVGDHHELGHDGGIYTTEICKCYLLIKDLFSFSKELAYQHITALCP